MSGLDKVVLEWFSKLFNNTYVLGFPLGKFTFLSMGGIMMAEIYRIKNNHKRS